jgi:hypothetical protein
MPYPYENLDPERFQQLCQTLLVREFPNTQCFPVAQRDGGRDAVSLSMYRNSGEFFVFQVKFVRNIHAINDSHKWLLDVLEDEAPKIASLIPKGASRYYLLTNVPGTAHLNHGSIDRVSELLKKHVQVPSMCWWKDDLDRRLDGAWDLKWKYPEVMSGSDFLRAIFESGLAEHSERRSMAIRSFVRDQYDQDKQVRFKQVDLQNQLLDLFVDVPIAPGQNLFRRLDRHALMDVMRSVPKQSTADEGDPEGRPLYDADHRFAVRDRGGYVGAATLLLDGAMQTRVGSIVLEGAPGQGKSTITQYVCQVHRMRILNDPAIPTLPMHHRSCPVRLPFRVDLRDFATWLTGKDPFSPVDSGGPPLHWHKSLQAFLAAQVHHYSGGTDFNVDDLNAIAKISALLIAFDGLDEVADIPTRREVVEEIERGVARLQVLCSSLQTIVTSRPAAFANSPGLPAERFPYLQLESLNRALINEYADKWLRARRLHSRESAEVKAILKEKLDQPHLRELARNPMQLTILLSLIHTRGASLPDKRTALYDSYIDLFFSRESTKSPVVRDYRDLLVDIHRYIAWVLHAEAEQGRERGQISSERLQALVSEYLLSEGHDVQLAKLLFTGLVERVVALVSRVEGTYEFEVQPLREYFAARYLYDTAPYSPPGDEQPGAKPERFDALAKNFYWLNVTRFFAGCFSKGELAALIDRLKELLSDNDFRYTNHPRLLGAMFLSDWVFSQYPKSVHEAIRIITDVIGVRALASSTYKRQQGSTFLLPERCGRSELIAHAFEMLKKRVPLDFATDLIDIIRANATTAEIGTEWWQEAEKRTGLSRTDWVNFGLRLGMLKNLTPAEIENLLSDSPLTAQRISMLLKARQFGYFDGSKIAFEQAISAILDSDISPMHQQRSAHVLEVLPLALDPDRYAIAFSGRYPVALREVWSRSENHHPSQQQYTLLPLDDSTPESRFVNTAISLSETSANEWATSLKPWNSLVNVGSDLWGSRWSLVLLANFAAGIRSTQETCTDFSNLLDHTLPICNRTRYARLRAGSPTWWRKQIKMACSEQDYCLVALLAFTWCSPTTLRALRSDFQFLDQLPLPWWTRLSESARRCNFLMRVRLKTPLVAYGIDGETVRMSERQITALSYRADRQERARLLEMLLRDYSGDDLQVLSFCEREALERADFGQESWRIFLPFIAKAYECGATTERKQFPFSFRRNRFQMSLAIAEEIAGKADKYPGYLVAAAENSIRAYVSSRIVPVGRVAAKDGWFRAKRSRKRQ